VPRDCEHHLAWTLTRANLQTQQNIDKTVNVYYQWKKWRRWTSDERCLAWSALAWSPREQQGLEVAM